MIRLITILLACSLLTACPAVSDRLRDYDRTVALVADVNTKGGAIEYEIRPAAVKGQGGLGGKVRIQGSLADGKQVLSLER